MSTLVITVTSTAPGGIPTEFITTSTLFDTTTAVGQFTTNPTVPTSSMNPFEPDPTQSNSDGSSGATQAAPVSPIGAVSQKSNTGAIVGGVIGGLLILILGGLLLRWGLVRWRRAHMAPSAAFMAEYGHERPKSWAPLNDSTTYLTSQRFVPEDVSNPLDSLSHGGTDNRFKDTQYQEGYIPRVK